MVRVVMHAMQAAKDPAWGYVPAEGEAERVQNISCCFCIDRPRRCMNFIERWMIRCCIGYQRRILRFLECLRGQPGGKKREKMTDVRKVGFGARGGKGGGSSHHLTPPFFPFLVPYGDFEGCKLRVWN